MKTLLLVVFILFIQSLTAYTWIPFGEFSDPVYNIDFYLEELGIIALSTEDTLYIQQEGIWHIANTHHLTVWDTEYYDDDNLLLVMGGGSNSDGIYMLNLDDLNDEVINWIVLPRFIHYNSYDNRYYVGTFFSISLSQYACNLIEYYYNWIDIPTIPHSNFYKIANYNSNYIITSSDGVYHKEFTNPPVFVGQPDPPAIENDELDEISGIVASLKNTGIFWVLNDSGGENAVYGFDQDGEHVAKLYLEDVENRDWEDIAIIRDTKEICVADIGDNGNVFSTKYIYRFEEPFLDMEDVPIIDTVTVSTISFQYPEENYDAETLICDPQSQDLYIVTKRKQDTQGGEDLVFKLPYPHSTSEIITADLVGGIAVPAWFNPIDEMYYGATAGDMSTIGDEIIIKTYSAVYYWKKIPGQTIDELISTDPDEVAYLQEPQGEALCWDKYGTNYYTVSEEPVQIIPAVLKEYSRNDWQVSQDSMEIVEICFASDGTCYGRSNAQDPVSYIYVSEDYGVSWEVLIDSPYGHLGALAVDSQDNLFIGWRGYNGEPTGVARWDFTSEEFIFMNEGIEGRSINKLLQFPVLEIPSVIACTDSGAYYLTDYTYIGQTEITPPCSGLKCFPNPAISGKLTDRNNTVTTIQFEISIEEHVYVEVYNMKGQKVKTLFDRSIPAGLHQLEWDGSDSNGRTVSSGVYFCRVTIQGNSSFTKMVILRT
jgi:hypothetical protein